MSTNNPPPDLTTATKVQALLKLYKEQCNHGRHTESQRHLITAMFLTAAGALLTIVSYNHFAWNMWPLSAVVCILGFPGLGFARVYEIKWDEGGVCRNHYRRQLEDIGAITKMSRHTASQEKPKEAARKKSFSSLRSYWRATFAFVIFAGAVATWMSLTEQF